MKGTTTGRDIFQALENASRNMACHGIGSYVWLATDGAPAMRSSSVDVVGFVENKLNSRGTEKVNFVSVHCILHQKALLVKVYE